MTSPKTAATDADVGRLHRATTKIYLAVSDKIINKLESTDDEEIQEGLALCSPAILTSMSNWVKRNDVTCQPEEMEAVNKNKGLLKDKKRRGVAILRALDPTGTV
jgi:hypothetical protein